MWIPTNRFFTSRNRAWKLNSKPEIMCWKLVFKANIEALEVCKLILKPGKNDSCNDVRHGISAPANYWPLSKDDRWAKAFGCELYDPPQRKAWKLSLSRLNAPSTVPHRHITHRVCAVLRQGGLWCLWFPPRACFIDAARQHHFVHDALRVVFEGTHDFRIVMYRRMMCVRRIIKHLCHRIMCVYHRQSIWHKKTCVCHIKTYVRHRMTHACDKKARVFHMKIYVCHKQTFACHRRTDTRLRNINVWHKKTFVCHRKIYVSNRRRYAWYMKRYVCYKKCMHFAERHVHVTRGGKCMSQRNVFTSW